MRAADVRTRFSQWLSWVLLVLLTIWCIPRLVHDRGRRAVEMVADSMPASASAADLPPAPPSRRGVQIRLGFVGDIMQHREQANDDFRQSYALVAPRLRAMDLAVANLEFPVDTTLRVGPDPGTVRFNGSPAHLDAIAAAGIDVLQTANNHAFDRGVAGVLRTLDAVEGRGLLVAGTARSTEVLRAVPRLVNVRTVPIAFRAYTIPPNAYLDDEGRAGWPPRDLPMFALDFDHWEGDDRAQGIALFREHVTQARAARAVFVVALVHWGKEYYLRPTADQRRAAHDLVDAGFDLVIGTHSHVLNAAEIYRGKLVAYSLGNFNARALRPETATGALLEVVVSADSAGSARVVDFRYRPTVIRRRGHVVVPVDSGGGPDAAAAWIFARHVLGSSLAPWR